MRRFRFICGDDDFLVQDRGRGIFQQMVAALQVEEYSREIIDGRAGNLEEVEKAIRAFASALVSMSLFGDRKAVWFKDISFLGDTLTGRSESTQELLEQELKPALEAIDPASVGVVLTAFPVDRRRTFYKWLQKAGETEFLGGDRDNSALHDLLRQAAAEAGVTFARGAGDILIERVGGNARLVQAEARKLATYAGRPGEVIGPDLVNALVPQFGDADFFEAAEVFFTLDLGATLEALKRHFFTHPEARGLIANLQRITRLLIQLRVLLDAGDITPRCEKEALEHAAGKYAGLFRGAEEKSAFNVFTQNPFYLSRLAATASRLKLRKLLDFQQAFHEAFVEAVDRPHEHEAVLRETAIRCLA